MAKKPKRSVQKSKTPSKRVQKASENQLEWIEQSVEVRQLKPYERNPRRISKDAFETLVKSLKQDGYHQRILATHDLRIIGGHQRIRALKEVGLTEVKVLIPSRPITDEEFKRILIRDNLPFGEFDYDMLSTDFEIGELVEMGMPADWLAGGATPNDEESGDPKDDVDPEEEKPITIVCPACLHEFEGFCAKKPK